MLNMQGFFKLANLSASAVSPPPNHMFVGYK